MTVAILLHTTPIDRRMSTNKLTNLLLLVWVVSISAFSTHFRTRDVVLFGLKSTPGDFPPEEAEEYTGTVDWDAEWKKVVASDGKTAGGATRPGKDFYKSEAEIAAIKAANKAAERAAEASSSVLNSLPDVRSLSGDWRVSGSLHKDMYIHFLALTHDYMPSFF